MRAHARESTEARVPAGALRRRALVAGKRFRRCGAGRAGESRRRSTPVELDRRQLLVAQPAARACGRATTRPSCARSSPVLADARLNVTRSFCFWPDFVPEPGRLDEPWPSGSATSSTRTSSTGSARSRPSSSATCRARTGIRPGGRDATSTATSGSSPSRPGSRRRSRAASARTRRSSAGSSRTRCRCTAAPGTSEEITAWARLVVQAVRSTGAHAADLARRRRVGRRGLRQRQRLLAARARPARRLRRAARLSDAGRPGAAVPDRGVRLRARRAASASPSCSRSSASPPTSPRTTAAADYYRQVLHTSLLAGARGWIAWNNCDYDDLRDEDPYRHHAFEMHFGLTDRAGRPKPQLGVLAEFAALVESWQARAGSRSRAARRSSCPSISSACCPSRLPPTARTSATTSCSPTSRRSRPISRSSSCASATASHTDAPLILAPCAKLLTAPGIDRLRDLARDGATVYLSYFAGSTTNQRGPWLAWLAEIFGVRHRLRYGLVDPIVEDEVVLEFVRDFGDIVAGTRLRFRGRGRAQRACVPPGRARGCRDRRRRRSRPPCAPAARARLRQHRALHLSARAHGGADAPGQPGGHVAPLLGARPRRRGCPADQGRRPAGARRPCPATAQPKPRSSSTARATRSRSSRSSRATSHRRAVRAPGRAVHDRSVRRQRGCG